MKRLRIPQNDSFDWLLQVTFTTWRLFVKNSLQNHAAATAFYFMLAATPVLLLLSYGMQWLGKLAETYVPATMLFAALYNQLQLESLTTIGFLPKQTQLAAGGVGLLTLLLSSRGLLNAVQSAFKIIFPEEAKRKFLAAWLLPLIIIPIAFGFLGLAGATQAVLGFFTQVELIGGMQASLLKMLNTAFMLLTVWLLMFMAYWRLPLDRPPVRLAALIALLAALSQLALLNLFGHFFRLERYQSVYGTLGGAVFVLIGAYFSCVVFYLWAQSLFAINRVDVEALEKLFLSGSGEGSGKLESFVFGRANRLLEKYGRTYQPGETLINEGEDSQNAFFLYSGKASVLKRIDGHDRALGSLAEGQLFGEMAYLLNEKRTATVKAETVVVALVLPPVTLEQMMRNSASLSRRIIDTLCQRLEKMNAINPPQAAKLDQESR